MNTRLLRKIQRTILLHYRQLDMDSWFEMKDEAPRCRTTACIAGWAVTYQVAPRNLKPIDGAKSVEPEFGEYKSWMAGNYARRMLSRGRKALGLGIGQDMRLFFDQNWPEEFRDRLALHKPGHKRYAKVVADRIEHFIETKGKE